MGALVQNAYGQWFYFYWGSSSSMMYTMLGGNGTFVLLDPLYCWGNFFLAFSSVYSFLYNRDVYVNRHSAIRYSSGLTGAIYLAGDFTKTYNYYSNLYKEANYINNWRRRQYNLYSFNCKHATLKGLLQSPCVYNNKRIKNAITYSYYIIAPNDAFAYLRRYI